MSTKTKQRTRDVTTAPVESDEDSSDPEILDDDIPQVPSQPLPQPKLRERSITPPPDDLTYEVANKVQEVLR